MYFFEQVSTFLKDSIKKTSKNLLEMFKLDQKVRSVVAAAQLQFLCSQDNNHIV